MSNEEHAVQRFKVPQKVKHDEFGIGQTIAYDSESRKYTVEFGEAPVIRRRVEGFELHEHIDRPTIAPVSLAVYL